MCSVACGAGNCRDIRTSHCVRPYRIPDGGCERGRRPGRRSGKGGTIRMGDSGQAKERPSLDDGILKGDKLDKGSDDVATQLIVQRTPMFVDNEQEDL